jgi:hypothetical protein
MVQICWLDCLKESRTKPRRIAFWVKSVQASELKSVSWDFFIISFSICPICKLPILFFHSLKGQSQFPDPVPEINPKRDLEPDQEKSPKQNSVRNRKPPWNQIKIRIQIPYPDPNLDPDSELSHGNQRYKSLQMVKSAVSLATGWPQFHNKLQNCEVFGIPLSIFTAQLTPFYITSPLFWKIVAMRRAKT